VHTPSAFDYAVIRVVPWTEREEFFNAGVILFCPQRRFLGARVELDLGKLAALAPHLAAEDVRQRLGGIVEICAGNQDAGPIAQMSQSARFHWLTAPRSTLLQVSAVHAGICEEPEGTLERLFEEQVTTGTGRK
jgi:hypothetical protein